MFFEDEADRGCCHQGVRSLQGFGGGSDPEGHFSAGACENGLQGAESQATLLVDMDLWDLGRVLDALS